MVILVMSRDAAVAAMMQNTLENSGHEVIAEHAGAGAERALRCRALDLILADKAFETDIENIAAIAHRLCPDVPLVMLYRESDDVPETPDNIWDRLAVPVDQHRLSQVVHMAECHKKTRDENERLRGRLARSIASEAITGLTSTAESLRETVRRAGDTNANIFITGEPGSGKSHLARALHDAGPNSDGPFVVVHCDPWAEEIDVSNGTDPPPFQRIEQQATGGTVFLDEVADATSSLRTALLKMLDRLDACPKRTRPFRVIASSSYHGKNPPGPATDEDTTTHQNKLIRRLNVLHIHIPSLRERPEDLLPLADEFFRMYAAEHELPRRKLTTGAAAALLCHDWPGNIRELSQVIERLVLLHESPEISAEDLRHLGGIGDLPDDRNPTRNQGSNAIVLDAGNWRSLSLDEFNDKIVARLERRYLCTILRSSNGCVRDAAKLGRIPQRTFKRLLRRHKCSTRELVLG